MQYGIGIDLVEIARFVQWYSYSDRSLSRIFSFEEILYCRAEPRLAAQRFAVRFAAREALYKALTPWFFARGEALPPFLTLCAMIAVRVTPQGVGIEGLENRGIHIALSLSHTETMATAVVLVSQRPLSPARCIMTLPGISENSAF